VNSPCPAEHVFILRLLNNHLMNIMHSKKLKCAQQKIFGIFPELGPALRVPSC